MLARPVVLGAAALGSALVGPALVGPVLGPVLVSSAAGQTGHAAGAASVVGVPAAISPAQAVATVRAAFVDLSRRAAFRTVRVAPSLRVTTLVEPRHHAQSATLHFAGPHGAGTVRSVVAGGIEDLAGDPAGWADFLLQAGAAASDVAQAPTLAGTWYSTPTTVTFGPTVGGIGHVLCVGSGCSLAGARVTRAWPGRLSVALPHLGGTMTLRTGAHPLPLAFAGSGASSGIILHFGYPRTAPLITAPASTAPLPAILRR